MTKAPILARVDLGDAVALRVNLSDPWTGRPVDGEVTLVAVHPEQADLEATAESVSDGLYAATILPTAAGRWLLKASVGGTLTGVEYGVVIVRPAPES